MNGNVKEQKPDERALVKLYMELTGASETGARGVYMYLDPAPGDAAAEPKKEEQPERPAPGGRTAGTASLLLALSLLAASAISAPAATNLAPAKNFISTPLSLADAVDIALHQNPSVLRAQKDIEATEGVILQTRAVALPKVGVTGSYAAVQDTDIDNFRGVGFSFGTDQNFSSQVKVVQSFYEGGRLLSAFRVARLSRQQSFLNLQTVVANTVLEVQLAYYDVLLAGQQILVQEASVELLTRELNDTNRRYEAGTVPRFNVLRAEVELANARPKLIRARNALRTSKNTLATLLGFNLPPEASADIPLNLSGRLEAEPLNMELSEALRLALERRYELGSLRVTRALRKEDIVNARSGYKPSFQGYGGYDVHNSQLESDLNADLHGWIAGAQLTWYLFDGLKTSGRIKEALANYDRAGIDLDDMARRIELDVRTAHSNFIEAREVLESQKKVVEEAEEALRLARARAEAGTSTQLDVLSAQTALTEARTTQVQALHDYAAARARVQRAVGLNVPQSEAR